MQTSFNNYKQIGRLEGMNILKKMNESNRMKLKDHFVQLGTGRKSIASISNTIRKEYGYETKNKFMEAVKKHYVKTAPDDSFLKEKNLKYIRSQRTAEEMEIKGGLSKVKILASARHGAQGTTSQLGTKNTSTSFASQAAKDNNSLSSAGGFAANFKK